MKENHIVNILESTSFMSLNESDRRTIQAHTANCADCARAYKAAMVSTSLLRGRASETQEPPPFFQTRVLAVLRERQSQTPTFARMWRAAGALVSSMAATVALLAVLSFLGPANQSLPGEASAFNSYSAEEVILNQTETAQDQASDAQVLTTLYDAADDAR